MILRKKWSDSIKEATNTIKEFQSGKRPPLRTGIPHFDEKLLGGLLGGELIILAGLPQHGKSYFLQKIERNVFTLNPERKIALLRFNFEMPALKLLLRSIQYKTKLPMTDILFSPPKDKDAFNEVVMFEKRYNIEHIEDMISADDFEREVQAFVDENSQGEDKADNLIVSIDHLGLLEGSDLKNVIDDVIKHCIRFKRKYNNLTFIALSQMNRKLQERTNPIELAPRSSDLFQSSFIEHGADLIVAIHNPYRLGHRAYIPLPTQGNEHLSEFFMAGGHGHTVNLKSDWCVYYHYMKTRTPDKIGGSPDIYGEHLPRPQISLPAENPFGTNVKSENPFA